MLDGWTAWKTVFRCGPFESKNLNRCRCGALKFSIFSISTKDGAVWGMISLYFFVVFLNSFISNPITRVSDDGPGV